MIEWHQVVHVDVQTSQKLDTKMTFVDFLDIVDFAGTFFLLHYIFAKTKPHSAMLYHKTRSSHFLALSPFYISWRQSRLPPHVIHARYLKMPENLHVLALSSFVSEEKRKLFKLMKIIWMIEHFSCVNCEGVDCWGQFIVILGESQWECRKYVWGNMTRKNIE